MKRFLVALFPVLPFVLFIILGKTLYTTRGNYQGEFLFWVLGGLVLAIWAQYRAPKVILSREQIALLVFGIAYFAARLATRSGVIYANDLLPLERVLDAVYVLLLVAMVIYCFWVRRHKAISLFYVAGAIALVLLVLARFYVLAISPTPHIDVFTILTEAIDRLGKRENPYAIHYPDIYDGKYAFSPFLVYWPAVLYWIYPARAFLGDLRYAYCLADLLSLGLLIGYARELRLGRLVSFSILLLWFSFPATFIVVENAWTEAMLLPFLVLCFLMISRNKWGMVGCLVGILVAGKQYLVYFAALTLLYAYRTQGRRAAIRFAVSAAFTSLLLLSPFILWNWGAFYESSVETLFTMPYRYDSLSFVSFAWNEFQLHVPGVVLVGLNFLALLLVLASLCRRSVPALSDLSMASVTLYAVSFLTGKQAFCNYYYFLAFLLLLGAMSRISPREALGQRSTSPPSGEKRDD